MDQLQEENHSKKFLFSKSLLLNLGIFVVLMGCIIGVWFVWNGYLSPSARSAREMQKSYEEYRQWEEKYQKAIAEDSYGGKTPEETLQLFISALEKEDIDLASKYFMYDTSMSKQKWVDWLSEIKNEGNMQRFAADLKVTPHEIHFDDFEKSEAGIIYLNNERAVGFGMSLKFNTSTAVWKIESM